MPPPPSPGAQVSVGPLAGDKHHQRLIRSSRSKSICIEYNQAYMAMVPSVSSHHRVVDNSPSGFTQARCDEARKLGPSWYFSRKEIEENSPSRRDGIGLKKESKLRKLYCKFLQELGMELKMPQVTIATAMIFCHRFYLRQSLAKNDRRIIATVCIFLAGKVEETPKPLKDIIMVSYGMIHKDDPKASQRIKQQKAAYFALPAVRASSYCSWCYLLAAKFLKVKLPSDGDKYWWQDFDVTARQLEEVSTQLLEVYGQNRSTRAQSLQGSEAEAEGRSAGMCNQRSPVKSEASSKEPSAHGYLQAPRPPNLQHALSTSASGHYDDEHSNSDKHISGHEMLQNDNANHGGSKEKNKSGIKIDTDMDRLHHDKFSPEHCYSKASDESHNPMEEHQPHRSGDHSNETRDGAGGNEVPVVSTSRMHAMSKIDKAKVKAALEKRRKSKGGFATKVNLIDDDDLLERELEQGVELAVEAEKIKQDKEQSLSDGSMPPLDLENADQVTDNGHQVKQSLLPTTAEDMSCLMDSKEQHPPPLDKQDDVPEHKPQQLDDTLEHQKGHDRPQLVGSPEQDEKD